MQAYNTLKQLYDFIDEYFHPYTVFYTAITDTALNRTYSAIVQPSESTLYYVFILNKSPLRRYFSVFHSYKAALYFIKNESFIVYHSFSSYGSY